MKKCICKKCEDCRLFISWDMQNKEGVRQQKKKCIMFVLAEEVPRIRGSIDGCQQATNETRNKVLEFSDRAVKTLKGFAKYKLLEGGKNESSL